MAGISQLTFSNPFSGRKMFYFVQTSFNFIVKCSTENDSISVQVVAWHQTGCESLPER